MLTRTVIFFLVFIGGAISTAFRNFTYTPDGYGAIKFSWSPTGSTAEDTYIDYIVCSPDLYHGDDPEDLVYFTRSTALVLSGHGFQERVGYTCTLSTMDTAGNLHDESIHVDMKSFGGLSIDFVNDSPSVQSNSVVAEFKITGSATKVVCCLIPKPQNGNKCVKCSSGNVSYSSLSPGYYRLRIFAKNSNYDSVVVRRLIAVPDSSYGCAVNLINGGFTVSDDSVTIQFAGSGALTGYACFLDNDTYDAECTSPMVLEGLESGWHSFKIVPVGDNCIDRLPLSVNFSA